MSTLAEIEEAIEKLPTAEFRELLRWLNEREAEAWDRQIEQDSEAGALDFLLEELDADIAAGRTRPVDEVCREP